MEKVIVAECIKFVFYCKLSSQLWALVDYGVARERQEEFRTDRDTKPDLFDVGAVLHHISYQGELAMWVHDKSVSFQCNCENYLH